MKSSIPMSKYDCDLNLDDRNSLSVLLKQVKPNSVILEFGPANGRMTKYMKEQLNCQVYAVEIDEKSAADAAQYTEKIIVDSIENYIWKQEFKDIKFDYIIFADVLEHLYYPEKVLLSVKDFLKIDGRVLISIPNIAHNAIIINLLKNEFNYSPTGLLDDTHIRFFTKKTFDLLIEKTGFFRSFETAIFLNPENTEFLNSYADLPKEISDFLRNQYYGEAYQFIYELQQKESEIFSDFSNEHKVYSQYFAQLFLDQGNGISEENSLKLPVAKNNELQTFTFDLVGYTTLSNFRLDPLNDSCVIEIEELKIIRTDGSELNLISRISSNACSSHGKSYFFEFHDPQITFEGLCAEELTGVVQLTATFRYPHIARGAVHVCANQIAADKNYLVSVQEQTKAELDQTKAELDQTKAELDQTKAELDQTKVELDQTKVELDQTKVELARTKVKFDNSNTELDQTKTELEQTKIELEQEYASTSYRVMKPLRIIKQILKGN